MATSQHLWGIPGFGPDAAETAAEGLSDPAAEFARVAHEVGVPQKNAIIAANYIGSNFSLDDPAAVWSGLRECIEISPSLKSRVWRTWCTRRGLYQPPELAREIQASLPTPYGYQQ